MDFQDNSLGTMVREHLDYAKDLLEPLYGALVWLLHKLLGWFQR